MRIYRIAAMFKTFGLEEKLSQSFKQHYKRMLRSFKDPAERKKYQMQFYKKKQIRLGSANISRLLEPIIEHYGEPKILPKQISFIIVSPEHPINAEIDANAFLAISKDGSYNIVKVALNFENIDFDYSFENTITHEVQHFLKSLYYGEVSSTYALEGGIEIERYYGDEWEIQAYAMNIAKGAVESIQTFMEVSADNKSREWIEEMKGNIMGNKIDLAKTFLYKSVNKFFKDIEGQTKGEFSPGLKRQYYEHSFRDFSSLFDSMIDAF